MSTPQLRFDRRVIEQGGTVHAGRYAGDRHSFVTACAVYPAPTSARIEASPERAVTCRGCVAATVPSGRPLFARQFLAVTDSSRPYIPELDGDLDEEAGD